MAAPQPIINEVGPNPGMDRKALYTDERNPPTPEPGYRLQWSGVRTLTPTPMYMGPGVAAEAAAELEIRTVHQVKSTAAIEPIFASVHLPMRLIPFALCANSRRGGRSRTKFTERPVHKSPGTNAYENHLHEAESP